jgi:hypothetical protein
MDKLNYKVEAKTRRIRRNEKRNNQYIQNKMFKEDTKQFYRYMGTETLQMEDHPHMKKFSFAEVIMGKKYNTTKSRMDKMRRK